MTPTDYDNLSAAWNRDAAERAQDEEMDAELEDGQFEMNGCLYCGACGMLAAPGDENYDWCDHRTGNDCPYNDDGDGLEDAYFEDDL